MGLSGPRNLIEIINPSVETRPLITPFFYDMQLGIGYESIKQELLSQKTFEYKILGTNIPNCPRAKSFNLKMQSDLYLFECCFKMR